MKSLLSLLLSILFHALLALCLYLCIKPDSSEIQTVSLDLSALTLSMQSSKLMASPSSEFGVRSSELPQPAPPPQPEPDKNSELPPPQPEPPTKPEPDKNSELRTPNSELNKTSELRTPNSELSKPEPDKNSELRTPNSELNKTSELRTPNSELKEHSELRTPNSELPLPPPPAQARIDAPARPKKPINPKYPVSSRENREEGTVTISLTINERGRVTSASILTSSGYPALDDAALRAARNARFTPAKSNGRSVSSEATIDLEFNLK